MRITILWIAILTPLLSNARSNEMFLSIIKFKNKTPINYIVYLRDRALEGKGGQLFISQLALWQPIMLLNADETGETEILLHDPEQFGSQLKLEPQTNDAAYPTIYLKGFIKTSGDCVENWYEGPWSLLITADEELLNNPLKDSTKTGTIRYCGYRQSQASIIIESDKIVVKNEHNAKILEPNKVVWSSLKQEERNEKK